MLGKLKFASSLCCLGFILIAAFSLSAQTKKRRSAVKKPVPTTARTSSDTAKIDLPVAAPPKKNQRPGDRADEALPDKTLVNSGSSHASTVVKATHFYEFSQPEFLISKIIIEHDDSGKGQISFMKKGYGELVSDPINVSESALEKINLAYKALDFLNSNESYQYEKDFSHLGIMKFKLKNEGHERTATFNWTTNKNAKILADEYRKIGNQFIWMFDISVARENQPLESPKLMDSLDSLIRRNEVSDSKQMVPFLEQLTNDERIPLIARNHAGKLIKLLEKENNK